MAINKRKHNLKIQMLAGNRLKSFPDARSQKTTTLVPTTGGTGTLNPIFGHPESAKK